MASTVGDSKRYLLVGRQAVKSVLAATMVPYSFFMKVADKTVIVKDVPSFKRNNRWQKNRGRTQTHYHELTVDGRVDSTQLGFFLCSAAGPPVGPTTHRFAWQIGQNQQYPLTAANSMLLSLQWGEGLALTWQALDARVSKISFKYVATGTWDLTVTLVCPTVTKIAQINDPDYSGAPADNSPFEPYQTLFTIGATPFTVVDFSIDFDLNLAPFFGSPQALPAPGALSGLAPIRFTEGEISAKYKATLEFNTVDLAGVAYNPYAAGNPYYDTLHDTNEAWVLHAIDADTDLGTGVHPGFEIDMTKLFGEAPLIDRDKPNVFQTVDGEALCDDSLTPSTGATVYLTNAKTAYTGD